MQAGKLRSIVTIQANTGNVPDGYGEFRPVWTALYSNIPAQVQPVSSRELWSGETVKTQGTHRIYLRYAPGITTHHRVIFEGRTFSITGVIDKDERHISLELMCMEQVN